MTQENGPAVDTVTAAYDFPVERGKIREFARATKARTSSFTDDPETVCPPTFLTAASFWAGTGSSAIGMAPRSWSRVLHGEQEYVFHGPPPRAGDRLSARQYIENVFEKQGRRGGRMIFTVVVTEFRSPAGDLVAEARSTVIETSQAAT
jgi:N-terminal half of MaoC dehydratase